MSQEEEKLIEEFINKIREIYNVVAHLPGKSLAFEDYILHHLRDGMHEAFRAGKLVGFEEGQRVLSKGIVRPDQSIIHNYFAGWNDALYKAIEQFEEEKKKL